MIPAEHPLPVSPGEHPEKGPGFILSDPSGAPSVWFPTEREAWAAAPLPVCPPEPEEPRPPQKTARDFPCIKCSGTGNVGYRRAGGVCFKCGGDGVNAARYADALNSYSVARRTFDKDRAKWEETVKRIGETRSRIWEARGEPSDWFSRFAAGLPCD